VTEVAGRRCPPVSVAELDRLMVAVETIAASHGPTRTTEPPYPREACRRLQRTLPIERRM
jgi:hypothetical protein